MARWLIIFGLILITVGLFWKKIEKWGLGRLPGDIYIKGDQHSFYFPIVTCLLISLLFSAIMWLINWFQQ